MKPSTPSELCVVRCEVSEAPHEHAWDGSSFSLTWQKTLRGAFPSKVEENPKFLLSLGDEISACTVLREAALCHLDTVVSFERMSEDEVQQGEGYVDSNGLLWMPKKASNISAERAESATYSLRVSAAQHASESTESEHKSA